jgi:hypothetical protein
MFLIDKKVYKCKLLSISPDARINVDKSRKDNILNAETTEVAQVFVVPTLNRTKFREITTNRIIPAISELYQEDYLENYGGIVHYSVPNSACFIKYSEREMYGDYKGNSLIPATAEEVENYVIEHRSEDGSFADYNKQLDALFLQAEENYENSKSKGVISDKKAIKNTLRSLRKKY